MWKYLVVSMAILLGLLLLVFVIARLFLWLAPVFGGRPDAISQEKIKASSHFNGQVFNNRMPTHVSTRNEQSPTTIALIKSLIFPPADKNPRQPLPSKIAKPFILKNGEMAWLGHSTVIFKSEDVTVITDPVFYRASPIFLGGKPFELANPVTTSHLPDLDVVIISHDHYDHLDMYTIREINPKVKQFLVPLGVKAHLQHWGVADNKIIELDWYESTTYEGVKFTLTPSRHFSGRGFSDRNTTLWGSWVVKAPALSLYFSGDGGYSPDFKDIGDKYGPFDIALMENGAYDHDWSQIHMFPEETAQATKDLRSASVLPIHWGKFDLARHHWIDPIERLTAATKVQGVEMITPYIGEIFTLDAAPQRNWWAFEIYPDKNESSPPQLTAN